MSTTPAPDTTGGELVPVGSAVVEGRAERGGRQDLSKNPAGMVQTAHPMRSPLAKQHKVESWILFGVVAIGYSLLGYRMVVDLHVVGFEALDRLARALMVWHNDPPKIAAIGFDYPPVVTMALTPLTIFSGLASSLVALPISTAIFAGIAVVALNSAFRRCRIPSGLRYLLLLLVVLNPLVALYGSNGARSMIWISLLVAAVSSLLAWYVTIEIRYILVAGLAFSVAALAGYGTLFWAILAAFAIGSLLLRHGARQSEVEGTVVGFGSPVVYVVAIWTVFSTIILGNPIAWVTTAIGNGDADATLDGGQVIRTTGELIWAASPLTIVVLPLLLVATFMRRNEFAGWLALFILTAALAPTARAFIEGDASQLVMRDGLPTFFLTVLGAAWLIRSAGEARRLLVTLLVAAGLAASIGVTWQEMKTYPYQSLERPFIQALETGKSQEGATNLQGAQVGIVSELAMAKFIEDNVSDRGSILTDNSQTYGVIVLTGKPQLFFDRVDKGDGPWIKASRKPPAKVKFFLMYKDTELDALAKLYPEAAQGGDGTLQVVYDTDRYALLGVPKGFGQVVTTSDTDEGQ